MRALALLLLTCAACGGAAAVARDDDDVSAEVPRISADASGIEAGNEKLDAAEAAAPAPKGCGLSSPFSQLKCFAHMDGGRAGTSHYDGCDAGDASHCYALEGSSPRLWCCPREESP